MEIINIPFPMRIKKIKLLYQNIILKNKALTPDIQWSI